MSRVFVLGATGTIGRATVRALVERGDDVVCLVRPQTGFRGGLSRDDSAALLAGATVRFGDATDPVALSAAIKDERFDAIVSCLASRTGAPKDAWAIDYQANLDVLAAAQAANVPHFILLSAICVQKPRLVFQHAKLAFEAALIASGLRYSIVRPTAYFKSLSGQVARVKKGRPYFVFGDGRLTACKPISDNDLGRYIAGCLDDRARHDRILPIGGPGPAITLLDQGEKLFALLGRAPWIRRVPVGMLDTIIAILSTLGHISRRAAAKAELARIGRYYATESMLVWDAEAGRYDADATPETGSETLFDYYAQLLRGEADAERGHHAVF